MIVELGFEDMVVGIHVGVLTINRSCWGSAMPLIPVTPSKLVRALGVGFFFGGSKVHMLGSVMEVRRMCPLERTAIFSKKSVRGA